MSQAAITSQDMSWFRKNILLGMSNAEYFRKLISPFNVITGLILAVGIPTAIWRFAAGLGATTNLSNTNPWGLWLGFDMFFGVAIATGGFSVGVAVYILGNKDYKPLLRPALLTGFLGYAFAIIGLLFDLGRPWRLPYPFLVSAGMSSVLFLVAEHLALYLTAMTLEILPAFAEWLGLKKAWRFLMKGHMVFIILGSVLVMGHQSALGAMYLLMPSRLHPLWYTPLIPYHFLVSCIAGGLAMLIIESMISHKVFGHQVKMSHEQDDRLTLGLGKAVAFTLITYLALKVLSVAHGMHWELLNTGWGYWFMFEVLGFVLLPTILYFVAIRRGSAKLVRYTSIITVLGIMLNRFNVSMVCLNWDAPEVYIPKWSEILVTITLITVLMWVFRWVINRAPILYKHPDPFYADEH
ncbi:MAG: NrfD/PsrC family molybdoenzyme membrane anchor subunit [Candidatus Alcyoniella australis]|nr:NrfD/PsrC family molybdoenzyme membrane anchor subunit [Candidatus Alcyoniella australis]